MTLRETCRRTSPGSPRIFTFPRDSSQLRCSSPRQCFLQEKEPHLAPSTHLRSPLDSKPTCTQCRHPPQQSKPAVLLDSELQALKEYLDDDVNHELKAALAPSYLKDTSTLQQWPPSDGLKNTGLIRIPENSNKNLSQALVKLNRAILSNHCAEACLYSSNPVATAQSVLEGRVHDFIMKYEDPKAIHDALQLQEILGAKPNALRLEGLCRVLKVEKNANSAKSIFFLLNTMSIRSRIMQRGLLANGRMLHNDGDTSPCETRINQVTLNFSLSQCMAISASSITQHLRTTVISSPGNALRAQSLVPSPRSPAVLPPPRSPQDGTELKLRKAHE